MTAQLQTSYTQQISSQFRKPSSPLMQTHPKYIPSPLCRPTGHTRQGVCSSHSLETILHSLQQACLWSLIHTTQNFKWPRYTLTTLNTSQLQTSTYHLEIAHPHTTEQHTCLTNNNNNCVLSWYTVYKSNMDINIQNNRW